MEWLFNQYSWEHFNEPLNWQGIIVKSNMTVFEIMTTATQRGSTRSEWHHYHCLLSVCFHDRSCGCTAEERRTRTDDLISVNISMAAGWTCMRQQPAEQLWQGNSAAWGHYKMRAGNRPGSVCVCVWVISLKGLDNDGERFSYCGGNRRAATG